MFYFELCCLWLIITPLLIVQTAGISLPPCATWEQTAITVAGSTNGTNGSSLSQLSRPFGISITDDHVLYVCDQNNQRIVFHSLTFPSSIKTIGSGPGVNVSQFKNPANLFPTNDSLYVIDHGNHRVQKSTLNGSNLTTFFVYNASMGPYYIYVDDNDHTYLSDHINHQVVVYLSNVNSYTVVAGTGVLGANNIQLNQPYGVFVNDAGTLYIADCYNNRIMRWLRGALSGDCVAGNGTAGSSSAQLYHPTQVIVDTNEFLYISEADNSRITRWGPNSTFGVCIAACTGTSGIGPNQLNGPHSLAFDSNGSLYVSDQGNNRVQKFQIKNETRISYNQPRFYPCAAWYPNATTFGNNTVLGSKPVSNFITKDNSVYVTARGINQTLMWFENSTSPTIFMSNRLSSPTGLFITNDKDIYVGYDGQNFTIDKWASDSTSNVTITVTYVTNRCYSLFIDHNETLYCSTDFGHAVVNVSLISGSNTPTIVAGNGTQGAGPFMLNLPDGIFVDGAFNLYVADCGNDRIQLFRPGRFSGTTIVSNDTAGTITLYLPTGVTLDGDGYLFIVDYGNHRIIGSGPGGYRCVAGCSDTNGTAADQLSLPRSLAFDNTGNLFVLDSGNSRIQKFLLASASNFCNETTAMSTLVTSTMNAVSEQTSTRSLTSLSTVRLNSSVQRTSPSFNPTACQNSTRIGVGCNFSIDSCDILHPCQNNGTCTNMNNISSGYTCSCLANFNGTHCEYDNRPCQVDTCWNYGMCQTTSNTTFVCQCLFGWQGVHCETRIDFCQNITFQHNGVCRSSSVGYQCQCVSESYSGGYCQITSKRLATSQRVSKSLAYVAILMMISAALFVVTMDLLKYGFGIDPVKEDFERLQQKKQRRKRSPPNDFKVMYTIQPCRASQNVSELVRLCSAYDLQVVFRPKYRCELKPFDVVSGYRSPAFDEETNLMSLF